MTIPGDFEGAQGDPAPRADAIGQWTRVVTDPAGLDWVKAMLELDAEADGTDPEELSLARGAVRQSMLPSPAWPAAGYARVRPVPCAGMREYELKGPRSDLTLPGRW